jgi:hypothetical protein
MKKNKVLDPLNDYQLLQESGSSYFFGNVDTIGVEGTPTLENTAKPYVINEETGEPGVVTGEPLNAVPRGDLDKNTYDNTSDVYYNPEFTYEVPMPESGE